MKIGRNDACPCGSGKKYKKCCIPKYDKPVATPAPLKIHRDEDFFDMRGFKEWFDKAWTPDKVKRLSDQEILHKLHDMHIPMTKEQFLIDIEGEVDFPPVYELWKKRYSLPIEHKDADLVLFAIPELWRRWAPDQIALFMLEDMMEAMTESGSKTPKLPQFETIWTTFKERFILPNGIRSFDEFYERFESFFDIEAIFFDFEGEFILECRANKDGQERPFDRLISLYEDILETLPNNDLENRLNIRRSIAEAHFYAGDYDLGERLFESLTTEHPTWVWGYVGWGDMYNEASLLPSILNKNKAEEIYRRGLGLAEGGEREALKERLGDV
ncbi:SEC-C metal-binding domain-containing protein [Effusibacillus lacus]|uniref:Preprotein translocase subunit SecA n=1 Tax=Effusibacillus lacus TaxID=1348429 RepID=A0A292YQ68_9BACL|nr:SEC-C metal-binding domain-containing protein [Effusibacillus lacus]TCS75732.1 SEC-C motif-containing protein [Effusibacillus lacus]GAX91049.1 hypothetical protein EFBL_2709 [Effusibacillus lacus]